ncbi:MAG: phytanoyl-CoA dioxygenase family protein [Alphaproteobacteria bacterium]|nr:phytanoyl-CoA dioxygenase family protein [Alphaproteobacteria bacterium]
MANPALPMDEEASASRRRFERDGFLMVDALFTPEEVRLLGARVAALLARPGPGAVQEEGSDAVRAMHGVHLRDPVLAELVRLPRLLRLGEHLLGGPVYLHQSKVTVKPPEVGDVWPWHQDSVYWMVYDQLPTDRCLNVAVFLDEVHDGNGPIQVLAGTHVESPEAGGAGHEADWTRHVSADLSLQLEPEQVQRALCAEAPRSMLGAAGSALVFHASLFHSSSRNRSRDPRRILILSYNLVDNAPPVSPWRPEFLAARSFEPLRPLPHDDLLGLAVAEGAT